MEPRTKLERSLISLGFKHELMDEKVWNDYLSATLDPQILSLDYPDSKNTTRSLIGTQEMFESYKMQ